MTQTPAEYAALNFDGTERRGNYRTVAYRIDILHICERKDAAAILFEIIYRWQTEVRKPEVLKEIERRKKANLPPLTDEEAESMMWVWMSYNDFVRESGEAVAYNTVIRMLDYLVETAQIIECRENHDPRYPDYEYRIRMDVVKEKLKALPAAPAYLPKVPKKKSKKSEESTHLGTVEKRSTQKGRRAQRSTQIGTESTQVGIATTQMGIGVYPNGGTSHTTTHTTHIEHTERDACASPARDEDIPYTPNFDLPPRETIEELSPVLEKEIQHVETLKEQASHIATLPQTDPVHGVGYEKPSRAATRSRANSEPKQSKRTSKSSSEAKKSEPLTMPPEDAPWNTTTCLHLFDFWRGAPLLRKDECIKASHCAKGLAENYTRKQVETVRRWMRERDPYWSQRASSVDVCQVAGQIHRILADIEAARQVKRAASTQAVDPQVAAVRALAQRFSAPVGER